MNAIEEVKKELLALEVSFKYQSLESCQVLHYRPDRWAVKGWREDEYRHGTLNQVVKIVRQLNEREAKFSEWLKNECKSIREQEKWEATHSTITGKRIKG